MGETFKARQGGLGNAEGGWTLDPSHQYEGRLNVGDIGGDGNLT